MPNEGKKKENLWYFGILGLLGGLINVLVSAMSLNDIFSFTSARILALAFLIGIFYWFLHTEKSWPDKTMAIISGYAGVAFVESVLKRIFMMIFASFVV